MNQEVLTVDEAAAFLRCHRVTVLRKIHAGKMPAALIGRTWRIRHEDLVALFGVDIPS